ncbi:MAG: hypothetical protein NVSMB19_17230 [Vulcanimicrobiaceae bacterium]
MRPIPIGAKGSFEALVTHEDLASNFKDATLPPVLSTPVMIKYMENAALYAVQPFLDANETAIGATINLRHLAPTPVGRWVRAEAQVTHVDGRRIEFTVVARDDEREIGAGTHERTVIDIARFMRKIDPLAR